MANQYNLDSLSRYLKKNTFIARIKDLDSFKVFLNVFHKIFFKDSYKEIFYKIDRVLSLLIKKIESKVFNIKLIIRNIRCNEHICIEDLYNLLYFIFIDFKIYNFKIINDVNERIINMDIKFFDKFLIKDILQRVKELKMIKLKRRLKEKKECQKITTILS